MSSRFDSIDRAPDDYADGTLARFATQAQKLPEHSDEKDNVFTVLELANSKVRKNLPIDDVKAHLRRKLDGLGLTGTD
jgi:hypothetical protein